MGELVSFLILVVGSGVFGYWRGKRSAERAFMGVHVGAGKGGKCHACGVLVEGGGLEMESHSRFYCKPQGRTGR